MILQSRLVNKQHAQQLKGSLTTIKLHRAYELHNIEREREREGGGGGGG